MGSKDLSIAEDESLTFEKLRKWHAIGYDKKILKLFVDIVRNMAYFHSLRVENALFLSRKIPIPYVSNVYT